MRYKTAFSTHFDVIFNLTYMLYPFPFISLEPIVFVDRPEVESVRENEEAIIKCMVTGVPEPTSMCICV